MVIRAETDESVKQSLMLRIPVAEGCHAQHLQMIRNHYNLFFVHYMTGTFECQWDIDGTYSQLFNSEC